jgi:DNA mismatch repair protein MutL
LSIRVLPPEVAARIAAGEVVERPASVVKELIENALDAGASRIAVEVKAGGVDSIRVTDDGCGIAAADLELAFARHATSKLDDSPDLSRILTLGFRGEALPSIAAVAEVEVVSRPPGAEAAAYLRLIPEAPAEGGSRGAPTGTSISVRGLFARQPARRKFLRSPASETNALSGAVSHYALAYPEVRFSLTLDGRQGLRTPGGGDLADAVAAVYGANMAGSMLAVSPEEGPILVQGLAAAPDVSRASRGYVSLFVNRRWIQNRRLAYAVEEAYQGLLMVGRHPVAVRWTSTSTRRRRRCAFGTSRRCSPPCSGPCGERFWKGRRSPARRLAAGSLLWRWRGRRRRFRSGGEPRRGGRTVGKLMLRGRARRP